jgi:signal peptidase I
MKPKVKTKPKPSGKKPKTTKFKSQKANWLIATLIAVMVLLFIRLFILQIFVVHSSSMSSNLVSGDWVVVNKLAYGPRIPSTLLSIPFSPERTSLASKNYFLDLIQLPYFRLPGYSRIKRHDIILFNYPNDSEVPFDKKIRMVKRCMGLPGDTLAIKNNTVFINGKENDIENIQLEYRVKVKNRILKQELLDKYNIVEGGLVSKFGEYDLYLSKQAAKGLSTEKNIEYVRKGKYLSNTDETYVFPHDSRISWTLSNYGPIVIPKAGSKIVLNSSNISIYRDILEKYEHCTITVNGDSVLINNKYLRSYYLKNNYYFVLDDNRDNAKDSRLWGFLPESHIIGKASFIICSVGSSTK